MVHETTTSNRLEEGSNILLQVALSPVDCVHPEVGPTQRGILMFGSVRYFLTLKMKMISSEIFFSYIAIL